MSDTFVKIGHDGPSLDTNAMRSAGKALLSGGAAPAAPASTPATSPSVPASAPVQSNVTVTPEQPVPGLTSVQEVAPGLTPAQPGAQPGSEGKVAETATPQPLNISDDALVELVVNGQKQVMKYGDAKKQMMLHATWTQNQQKLAAEKKAFEAERTQLLQARDQAAKLERLITDPELFAQYAVANPIHAARIAKMFGTTVAQATGASQPASTPAPPAISNPDELVNMGDLDRTFSERSKAMESRFTDAFSRSLEDRAKVILGQVEEVVDKKIALLQDAHEIAGFNRQIDKAIQDNLDANPALKHIPYIDQLLRFQVGSMQPESAEAMIEAIGNAAKGIVEGLDQTYNQTLTTRQIEKEKLTSEGIEAPGGQPVNTTIKPQLTLAYGGPQDRDFFKRMRQAGKIALG